VNIEFGRMKTTDLYFVNFQKVLLEKPKLSFLDSMRSPLLERVNDVIRHINEEEFYMHIIAGVLIQQIQIQNLIRIIPQTRTVLL
jgi:hypothetical protein